VARSGAHRIAPSERPLKIAEDKGEEGALLAAIARSKKDIGSTRLEIMQRDRDFQKGVSEELERAQSQLRDLRERAIAARDVLRRIDITAPVGGTVVNMSVHTIGAVIKPGETVMEIVPGKNNLIVEVRIRPQDIDNVSPRQPATLRLLAFKQRTTPVLNGEVVYVSADSIEDKQRLQGVGGMGSPRFYIAHIAVTEAETARLGGLELKPGMQAEVMIKTGDRTAFRYIIQPIVDSLNRAMREE
jgi:HlyD family type I secretion membrane fusion protein